MSICPTHGVDHDDPAEIEKSFKKLRRRYYGFMAAYLASIGLGLCGVFVLLGVGGFICATAAFLIHFFYHNMGFAGHGYIEMKTLRQQQSHQLRLVPPLTDKSEKPGTTYI